MDVFEQEQNSPLPSPSPSLEGPNSLSVDVDPGLDGVQPNLEVVPEDGVADSGLEDEPESPGLVPVDNVFDVEERRDPKKKKFGKIEKKKRQKSSSTQAEEALRASDALSTEAGPRMCQQTTDRLGKAWDSMTSKQNLFRNYKAFMFVQGLMYVVWFLMYSGLVIPVGAGANQVVLFCYLFVGADLVRRLLMFQKRCERIQFKKGVEYEFYSNALGQLKFHGAMVLVPLILLVLSALTFTYTMVQGLNYYNVRTPSFAFRNHTQSMLLAQGVGMFTGGSGCSDQRALNYDSRITDHDESRCEYVRCHEDVYDGSQWPESVRAFVVIYLMVFVAYTLLCLIVSYGHLRYFEGLYLERRLAMPFMREMWRKAVAAYTSHSNGAMAAVFGPARLRLLHGILIVTQGLLAAAMTVGKLSMTDLWFIEFDISVLLLGYECGRHSPHSGYVRATGLGDIYGLTRRLNWHRQSIYHYFVTTTLLAYLCVSGAYRIHPGTDYQKQPIAQTPGFDSQLVCHSGLSTEYRSASWVTIALLFVFLVGVSLWLSLAHYFQYQSVKRDHATLLSFARAFQNMLERRRKRVTYAYYDDTGPDLCPRGGFPVEYIKAERAMMSPRSAAAAAGDGDAEAYTRGKLFVTNDGIRYMPASGIEGLDDESTAVSEILAAKQEMGQPPRLVLTLSDDSVITIASQSTRSIKKSVERIMESFAEIDGGSNEYSSAPRQPSEQSCTPVSGLNLTLCFFGTKRAHVAQTRAFYRAVPFPVCCHRFL